MIAFLISVSRMHACSLRARDERVRSQWQISSGNQGRLDVLGHGISCHPGILTKIDNRSFAEAFHIDKIANVDRKPFNFFRIVDGFRVTFLEVYTDNKAPQLLLILLELVDKILIGHF